jgi:hypothetical protein
VIYLYAITEPSAPVPTGSGFDGAPLQLARSARVAALYSTHQSVEPSPQPDSLLRHEQVVEAAMRQGPTLPARFGTTFASDDSLLSAVERAGDHLRQALQRVRGCVELAVRVGLPEQRHTAPRNGRGYLEAKLADQREVEAISAATLAPLSELAVCARREANRSAGNVLCASYLVRADRVDRFANEVRLLDDRHPELWLSCTGPWPPYSFAQLEDAE